MILFWNPNYSTLKYFNQFLNWLQLELIYMFCWFESYDFLSSVHCSASMTFLYNCLWNKNTTPTFLFAEEDAEFADSVFYKGLLDNVLRICQQRRHGLLHQLVKSVQLALVTLPRRFVWGQRRHLAILQKPITKTLRALLERTKYTLL